MESAYRRRAAVLISGTLALVMCSCGGLGDVSGEKGPGTVTVSKGHLEADIMIPGPKAPYRGPRFSWAGIITQVRVDGHTFFGTIRDTLNPGQPVIGTAEEFGMYSPIGFAEADAGEPFLRIGVGWLEKTEEDYRFWRPYKILKTFPYEVKKGWDSITFVQEASVPSGYAYSYKKKVSLLKGNVIEVRSTLTNTGEKTIDVDQYSHNTFQFDRREVAQGYELHLPFRPVVKGDLAGVAVTRGKAIAIARPFGQVKALFAELEGFGESPESNRAVVYDSASAMGVVTSGDFPPARYNFYAEPDGFCPEVFVLIHLEPGESQSWTRTYVFRTIITRDWLLNLDRPEREYF
jgi:hypothetical protein